MKPSKSSPDPARKLELLAQIRRDLEIRQRGYRERALQLFPHVCASCGREFSGKKLKDLTVHHIDHDHTNNPPDGHNWELLCIYCHDHEHEKYKLQGLVGGTMTTAATSGAPIANPFAKLADLAPLERDDSGKKP